MYSHITKSIVLLLIFGMFLVPAEIFGKGTETIESRFIASIDWQLNSMSRHESLNNFINHKLFPMKWSKIRTQLKRLKSMIGKEITGENISTAREQYDFIVEELGILLKKTRDQIRLEVVSLLNPYLSSFNNVVTLSNGVVLATASYSLRHNSPEREPTRDSENTCPDDVVKNRKAAIALSNAGFHQPGSIQQIKYFSEALQLFYELASSECLDKNSSIKTYAKQEIERKKMEILDIVKRLKAEDQSTREQEALIFSMPREILALFQELDPKWMSSQDIDINMFPESSEIRSRSQKKLPLPAQDIKPAKEGKEIETVKPLIKEDIPEFKPLRMEAPGDFYALALDVWQSAWGDFSEIDLLISFLNRNSIKKINLNPGLPMGPKFYQEGYKKFKPLVNKFRRGGIQNIGFLYAELNYPIEFFAKFLYTHRQEFKIDTIVDDSEFVDIFKDRFEQNLRKVKQYGLNYSAFVTLESHGNSGVSDKTRYWVIDHIDYPILMSYFGCTLEEQKVKLEKYLGYADQRGIKRRVGIAILLGSKKVGREESCERLLNESQMKRFLFDLHTWALKNHPSYGGIVLETNLRMPKYNISK